MSMAWRGTVGNKGGNMVQKNEIKEEAGKKSHSALFSKNLEHCT